MSKLLDNAINLAQKKLSGKDAKPLVDFLEENREELKILGEDSLKKVFAHVGVGDKTAGSDIHLTELTARGLVESMERDEGKFTKATEKAKKIKKIWAGVPMKVARLGLTILSLV